MDIISILIIILVIILALIVVRKILIGLGWSNLAHIVGGSDMTDEAHNLTDHLNDYLQTSELSSQDLLDVEKIYLLGGDVGKLDEKKITPTKIKTAVSKGGKSGMKMVNSIYIKLVSGSLLHLHILKHVVNDVSLDVLKKNRASLKHLITELLKKGSSFAGNVEDLQKLVEVIDDNLTYVKGESIRKISNTSSNELALKMLLLEAQPVLATSAARPSYKEDPLLRNCRADNELLKARILNLREEIAQLQTQSRLRGYSSNDSSDLVRRYENQIVELRRRIESLQQDKANLENRLNSLSTNTEYTTTINKLRHDLGECEQNLRAALDSVAPSV